MPIEKVPVVHKFGIISHSQRLELQERLLKQSYLATFTSRKSAQQSRNPLEVTEEFINQYNAAESLPQKEKLEDTAHKMLLRIKRRAGLKDGGAGDHVDLPLAWTELSQLAQCKGKIQEECLDVLITSLDQAAVRRLHIPALFFLAETTLYWLRTDAVHQPYLRTGEIKLLRMGQLVFIRLFYHHMSGQLQGQDEFKNRLFTYLDGFAECQEAYSPYPNALLCVRYINEVGKIIIGDSNLEAGEIKEGDNITQSNHRLDTDNEYPTYSDSMVSLLASSQTDSDMRHSVVQLFTKTSGHIDESPSTYSATSHSAAISSSVHDLSPTLWHALDVWRCVNRLAGGLQDAIRALATCGMGLASESWVDGLSAMQVLGDAGKSNIQVLRAVQTLARGVDPRPLSAASATTPTKTVGQDDYAYKSESAPKGNHPLSDIYEKSENDRTSPSKSTLSTKVLDSSPESSGLKDPQKSPRKGTDLEKDPRHGHRSLSKEPTNTSRTTSKQRTDLGRDNTDLMSLPNTAWHAEVGSDIGAEGRASQASTVATFTNAVSPNQNGLHGWHWEVAIAFADILADICLHGVTSAIQKVALLGCRKDTSNIHWLAVQQQCPMESAGLLDLVYFHAAEETADRTSNDWSWRVRYTALQGLVKVCRCCASESTKEGMRTVAWNTLVKAHSLEKDQRVLEALKVGQVESSIENLISEHMIVSTQTIGAKIAANLSVLYLPPLPPPGLKVSPRKQPEKHKSLVAIKPKPEVKKPLRATLREEIMLATALEEKQPSFNSRTGFDLKRIVEDQWRKELQQQMNEDESERKNELEEKQKETEARQKVIEERRRDKLKLKYRGKAYQVQELPCCGASAKNSRCTMGQDNQYAVKSARSSLSRASSSQVST